jgi:hypothetical protein
MPDPQTQKALNLIATERMRHLCKYSRAHDKGHDHHELPMAAACMAAPGRLFQQDVNTRGFTFFDPWPWANKAYSSNQAKEGLSRKEQLVTAAALIVAELERMDGP